MQILPIFVDENKLTFNRGATPQLATKTQFKELPRLAVIISLNPGDRVSLKDGLFTLGDDMQIIE